MGFFGYGGGGLFLAASAFSLIFRCCSYNCSCSVIAFGICLISTGLAFFILSAFSYNYSASVFGLAGVGAAAAKFAGTGGGFGRS